MITLSDIRPTQREGYAERKAADKLKREEDLKKRMSERIQTLVYVKDDSSEGKVNSLYVINNYGEGSEEPDVKLYKLDTSGTVTQYLSGDIAVDKLNHLKELQQLDLEKESIQKKVIDDYSNATASEKAERLEIFGKLLSPESSKYSIYVNKGSDQIVRLDVLSEEMKALSTVGKNVSFSFPVDNPKPKSENLSEKTEKSMSAIDFINKKSQVAIEKLGDGTIKKNKIKPSM